MAQQQGNIKILQTLDDIAFEAAGKRHQLQNSFDFRPFETHPPRHNEADIAAAQNDSFFPGHIAFHIDEHLRRAGGIDAGGTGPGDPHRAAVPLSAAHG